MWMVRYAVSFKVGLTALMLMFAVIACDMDQNFPPLTVGAGPRSFDPWIGEIHRWPAEVAPGEKYQAMLNLGSIRPNSPYMDGHSSLYVNGDSCADCILSTDSAFVGETLLSFIGPKSGHVTITMIAGARYETSTMQLRE